MIEPDQIHNIDCFRALPEVPDQSVDAVITDPPYPNHAGLFTDTLVDGLAAIYQACKKAKKYVAFFWNPFDVPSAPPGWYEVARHVWHKPDCKSITHYEVIVVWSRENKRKVSRVWSIPILDYRSYSYGDWKPHPTQKPVRLLRYLIEHITDEGDTILDPFVGSGSTAVACQQLKRHFIAFEVSPEYAKIATDRLRKREKAEEKPGDRTEAGDAPKEQTENTPDEQELAREAMNDEPAVEDKPKKKKAK